jgi:hypothetical protein
MKFALHRFSHVVMVSRQTDRFAGQICMRADGCQGPKKAASSAAHPAVATGRSASFPTLKAARVHLGEISAQVRPGAYLSLFSRTSLPAIGLLSARSTATEGIDVLDDSEMTAQR